MNRRAETVAVTKEQLKEKLKYQRENPLEKRVVMDHWMMLADAIYMSGVKEHDAAFLDSSWAKYLKDMVLSYAADRNKQSRYDVHYKE